MCMARRVVGQVHLIYYLAAVDNLFVFVFNLLRCLHTCSATGLFLILGAGLCSGCVVLLIRFVHNQMLINAGVLTG
jgi:hypothetical protein